MAGRLARLRQPVPAGRPHYSGRLSRVLCGGLARLSCGVGACLSFANRLTLWWGCCLPALTASLLMHVSTCASYVMAPPCSLHSVLPQRSRPAAGQCTSPALLACVRVGKNESAELLGHCMRSHCMRSNVLVSKVPGVGKYMPFVLLFFHRFPLRCADVEGASLKLSHKVLASTFTICLSQLTQCVPNLVWFQDGEVLSTRHTTCHVALGVITPLSRQGKQQQALPYTVACVVAQTVRAVSAALALPRSGRAHSPDIKDWLAACAVCCGRPARLSTGHGHSPRPERPPPALQARGCGQTPASR